MRKIFSFCLILIIFSIANTFTYYNVKSDIILPAWTYIASEKNDVVLDGELDEWGTIITKVEAYNILEETSESLEIEANFGYNESGLHAGISVPHDFGIAYGLEMIFFGIEGVYDCVVIDADKNESYDQAIVDCVSNKKDVEIGGEDNLKSSSLISRSNTVFELSKSLSSEDEKGLDINLKEGDSIAIIFQMWIGSRINESKSPNYSSLDQDFSYLRLSIEQDDGSELHEFFPRSYHSNGEDLESYFTVDSLEVEAALDGRKPEEHWNSAKIYRLNFSLLDLNDTEQEYSTDQISIFKEVVISIVNDEDDIIIHLQIENMFPKMPIKELYISFFKEEEGMYNPAATQIVSRLKNEEHVIFGGHTSDFYTPGFMIENYENYDYFNVPHFRDPEVYGIYESESSPIINTTVDGVDYQCIEFSLPFLKPPQTIGNLFHFDYTNGDVCVKDLTLIVSPAEPADPHYNPFFKEINLNEEIMEIIRHRINFSEEAEETTKSGHHFSSFTIITISSLLIVYVFQYVKRSHVNAKLN
jgi:hypothetical protein